MLAESEALERLASRDFRFEPLQLAAVEMEPGEFAGPRPDCILTLRWQNRSERFAVEYKSLSTPRRLREAAGQVSSYAGPDLWPMVMAPYLDEKALDWLLREELSGLDFSGNGVVVVPGRWLVYRTGKPNAYPASQYIKAIFRGRSSLVGRVLLLRQEFPTVSAVHEEIERRGGSISLSTVSKVLSTLEEELIVSRREGVKLLQPDRLLAGLSGDFERPEVRRRRSVKTDDLDSTLQSLSEAGDARAVQVAARGERLYADYPGAESAVSVYCDDLDPLEAALELPEARRFAELELLETEDELVYFDRRRRRGVPWTSPVQVYLELANGGKRDREIAAEMREPLLAGAYE